MPQNTISGRDAVLYFFKNDWLEYFCSTDISLTITASTVPVKGPGDGVWQSFDYQDLTYSINLSGVLKFDSANFDGFDLIDNVLNFTTVPYKISFTDDAANIKSFEGNVLINSTVLSWSSSDFVKDDFTLIGNGKIKYYDGLIACPTSIDTLSISGQTGGSGTVGITYTYTGPVYQVKYRIDGKGNYSNALLGAAISIASLPVGAHTIEMIPICLNKYEGVGHSQSFNVTYAMVCTLAVTSISISGTGPSIAATVNFNSDPSTATIKYSLNGGQFIRYSGGLLTNPQVLNFNLTAGPYTLEVIPTCANGVDGTGHTQSFNVTTGSVYSTINWFYATDDNTTSILIYWNNNLIGSASTSNRSGTFSAASGDPIDVILSTTYNPSRGSVVGQLHIVDSTTSTTLTTQAYTVDSNHTAGTVRYSFTPSSGDTYTITANG